MKKKWISALIILSVLVMVLSGIPVPAPADSGVTLDSDIDYDDGRTTISWTGGEEGQKFVVILEATDNGEVKQQKLKVGETKKHKIEAVDMIPGKSYIVYVTDENYSILDSRTYVMPDPVDFSDGKLKNTSIKITTKPMKLKHGKKKNKDTKGISELEAKEIIKGLEKESYDYGVKFSMQMPQLKKARSFFMTITFESPDGFLWTEVADDQEFKSVNHGYQTLWFYMIGDSFFSTMYKCTGEVPKGKYKIHLFWDGEWVNTSTFKVK